MCSDQNYFNNIEKKPAYFPEKITQTVESSDILKDVYEYSPSDLVNYALEFQDILILNQISQDNNYKESLKKHLSMMGQSETLSKILTNKLEHQHEVLKFFIDNSKFYWKCTNLFGEPVCLLSFKEQELCQTFFKNISEEFYVTC